MGEPADRYSEEMRRLLEDVDVFNIGLGELEQFAYDVTVDSKAKEVIITTDEIEVSGFLKILLAKGARIEVFSAHQYPEPVMAAGAEPAL